MPVEVMPPSSRASSSVGGSLRDFAAQQLPVAPGTAVQQAVKLNLLQVHPVRRFHAVHLHGRAGAELGAEKIARNRVDPEANQTWIAQLITKFPATHPCGLRNLLGFFNRGSSRKQETPRGWVSSLKRVCVFGPLHHAGPACNRRAITVLQ